MVAGKDWRKQRSSPFSRGSSLGGRGLGQKKARPGPGFAGLTSQEREL